MCGELNGVTFHDGIVVSVLDAFEWCAYERQLTHLRRSN